MPVGMTLPGMIPATGTAPWEFCFCGRSVGHKATPDCPTERRDLIGHCWADRCTKKTRADDPLGLCEDHRDAYRAAERGCR